jgi:tetratricopeptide (TPR) repeat protein
MNTPARCLSLAAVLIATIATTACGNAQSRKVGYLQKGQTYFNEGSYEKARLEFRNANQVDPADSTAHYMLGQIAERQNAVRDAVAQYQAALKADPKQALARAALGRLYLYGALPDKAVELIEPGLVIDPSNAQLLTVRGGAEAQLGNTAAAFQDAKKAVQLAPSDSYAIALLASLYKKDGQLDQAVATIQTGLQRLPNDVELREIMADLRLAKHQDDEADVQLRAIIALQPAVMAHRYRLARLYLQQKNLDAAEKTLREGVTDNSGSVDAKVQLIEFLSAQRGADKADAQIGEFLQREPKNDSLKLALAQLPAQGGQSQRAETLLHEVIAHDGNGTPGLAARDQLAQLLLARGDSAAAMPLLAEVLKHNPRDNDALVMRSNAALARGEPQAAVDDLRAVLRDQPNAVPIMRALALAYQRNQEPDQAEEILRNALQVSPRDFQSKLDLAQVLLEAKKYDQASALLGELAKDNPSNLPVQESLYRVQVAQDNTAGALATAQSIEHTNPKLAMGYYLSGLVEDAQHKSELAAKDYENALQREPDAGEPLAALTRLELREKRVPAAMSRIDAVIAHSPDNPIARNLKAELLLSQGLTEAAIVAYQDTVKVSPQWAEGYQGLALAQAAGNHADDAVHSLQTGIERTQGSIRLIADLSNLYVRMGKTDDAIGVYESALAKKPGGVVIANNLAMLLVTYRQDSTSLARAQKLVDEFASSSEPALIDTRGWVRFKNGDFHGAESLLQQAVDKVPSPEYRYHLGMAQLRSGEQQSAEQNLESAVNASGAFPGIDEARATLAQLKKTAAVG